MRTASGKPIHVGPAMQIIHPDYGDITEGVARELALLREQRNREEVEQAAQAQLHIARTCGTESRIGPGGVRLVAQIDERVFNYWEAREGRDFWQNELKFMTKRHPELAVTPKSEKATILVDKPTYAVKGKRGRWAV